MTEGQIRTEIANKLDLFDSSLQLIEEEYYLGMMDGRKAFIDILAKDEYGCYTVIEIKKSNKTARTTVQQLLKYASFFKEKNRLESHQIRCIVLSTIWDELNAPFSEFKEFSDYEIKGYQLNLPIVNSSSFLEVNPKFIRGNSDPLKSFFLFKFKTKELRNVNLKKFEVLIDNIPSFNCVIYSYDFENEDKNYFGVYKLDVLPYAFTFSVYTGNSDEIESQIEILKQKLSINDTHISNLIDVARWSQDDTLESKLRSKIVGIYFSQLDNLKPYISPTDYIPAYEEACGYYCYSLNTLHNILGKFDSIIQPIMKGPMFDGNLFTKQEVINMTYGFLGKHDFIFKSKITPQRTMHFNTTRCKIDSFLKDNIEWKISLNNILNLLDQNDKIELIIFNPLNIFGLFNDYYLNGSLNRTPFIILDITKEDGTLKQYTGFLSWTGNKIKNVNINSMILNAYENIAMFKARSVFHYITEYDVKLSTSCGLKYQIKQKNEALKQKNITNFISSNKTFINKVGKLYKDLGIGTGNKTNVVYLE